MSIIDLYKKELRKAADIEVKKAGDYSVNILNVPMELMSRILTMASLHLFTSAHAHEMAFNAMRDKDQDSYEVRSEVENHIYTETMHRQVRWLEKILTGAFRKEDNEYEARLITEEDFNQWLEFSALDKMAAHPKRKRKAQPPITKEPMASAGMAVLILREVCDLLGHSINNQTGVACGNFYNQADSGLRYVNSMIDKLTEVKALLETTIVPTQQEIYKAGWKGGLDELSSDELVDAVLKSLTDEFEDEPEEVEAPTE